MPHPRAESPDELAEECRLMYVAVTRAKDSLVLSYSDFYGRDYQVASPFLPTSLKWM